MANDKKLKYELTQPEATYILKALNRTQIAGVNQAEDLLTVVKIIQNPLNKEELEKEQYETLKTKFEGKQEDTKK